MIKPILTTEAIANSVTIPAPLEDYLWKLVTKEAADVDGALFSCTLTPVELNKQPVQQIDFLGQTTYLTGFSPFQCTLYLILYPNGMRELLYSTK